jgi:hypothetical protein
MSSTARQLDELKAVAGRHGYRLDRSKRWGSGVVHEFLSDENGSLIGIGDCYGDMAAIFLKALGKGGESSK